MSIELDRIIKEENLFSILNITTDATSEDIRSAYKKLVKEVHPDRFSDSDEKTKAEEAFKRLGVAFNTLRDPLQRKDYERVIERYYPSFSTSSRSTSSSTASSGSSTGTSSKPSSGTPSGASADSPKASAPHRPNHTAPFQDPQVAKQREQARQEQAERHYTTGRDFERKNQMDDAVKEYQEAIRIKNEVAKYHSQLGLVLDKKGWSGYAQAEFKVALHFDPTDKLALKHYKPTAGASQSKGTGFKFLNIFRGADKGMKLGELLIKLGHLNKDQLQSALKLQNDEKLLLGEILIRKKYIKPEHLAQALIQQGESVQKQEKA